MHASYHALVLMLFAASAFAQPNAANSAAVQDVLNGARTEANAAWWGFDEEDATDALQAAINSGAKRVVVPNMTRPWIVRPIVLAGDQELVLEDGVVIAAKRGEYRGGGDSVFTAREIANLTIRGYGVTVRMNKEDYIVGDVLQRLDWHRWIGQYEKAEWRMCLAVRGCTNLTVLGLTLADSGGDGIYVDGSSEPSRNITIRDVTCDNNYRQGISVISVDGLLIENSTFKNTWGTPPSSGIDIEPDGADQHAQNIMVRNCNFIDNYGDGIEVFLANLKRDQAPDVSILFEDCRVTSKWGSGIRVTKIADDAPRGLVEFRRCTVENTQGYGIKVQDKSVDAAEVRFVDCVVRDAAQNRAYAGAWAPVWLHILQPELTTRLGGIEFRDCTIEDNRDRPAVVFTPSEDGGGELVQLKGTFNVRNSHGVRSELGENARRVDLQLVDAN